MSGSLPAAPGGCGRREVQTAPCRAPLLLLGLLTWGLADLPACSSGDPLDRRISQLSAPSTREQAIDALIKAVSQAPPDSRAEVQRRVVDALCEAYRVDLNRNEIVSALAFLKDRRAKHIFLAALKDAQRSGKYREAAIRSAQIIGELKLTDETPALLAALEQAREAPADEHGSWLERAIVSSLIALGDRRAVPGLIEILRAAPAGQDFYLNKLAARALGQLADERGISPLIDSLSQEAHGLLLFETSRRALCRSGPAAEGPLLARIAARDRGQQQYATATAAVRVLGDLGRPAVSAKLKLTSRDNAEFRLAVAETLLRLGDPGERTILREALGDSALPLSLRRHAAELLGWYGAEDTAELLERICAEDHPGQEVLCWATALAHCRAAGADGLTALDRLAEQRKDQPTQHYLAAYRERLALLERCGQEQTACLEQSLTAESWRVQERAALALGRAALQLPPAKQRRISTLLARAFDAAHPQVREAILTGLERLDVAPEARAKMARKLIEAKASTDPSIDSRAQCLGYRLLRTPGE